MCKTFYLKQKECTCFYILRHFSPCATYVSAHSEVVPIRNNVCASLEAEDTELDPFADPVDPFADPDPTEDLIAQVSRPKVLTQDFEDLKFSYNEVDFASTDVDDSWAPNGLECSETITAEMINLTEDVNVTCLLCDRPEMLKVVYGQRKAKEKAEDEKVARGKGKVEEKGVIPKKAKMKTATVTLFKNVISRRTRRSKTRHSEIPAMKEDEGPAAAEKKRAEEAIMRKERIEMIRYLELTQYWSNSWF